MIESSKSFRVQLDFDINGTIILEESSSGASWQEQAISTVAENTFYNWDGKNVTSYTQFVKTSLLEKKETSQDIKKLRREVIGNFINWLKESDHPKKNEALRDYECIKRLYESENRITIFPSFFVLLEKMRQLTIDFVIKLRTFGKHLDYAVKEIEKNSSGIKFSYFGKFSDQKLYLEGQEIIEKANLIFQTFSNKGGHFALKDDWQSWNKNHELASFSKPFFYDSAITESNARCLSLFFDDNITGEEHDIVYPIDVSGQPSNPKEMLNRLIFRVNTVWAIINPNYFVDLFQRALISQGCNPFSITADSVKEFNIDECQTSGPCSHECTLTLLDGRVQTKQLEQYEISALIQAIAKEKIKSHFKEDHFVDNSSFKDDRPYEFFPLADEVLTKAFN